MVEVGGALSKTSVRESWNRLVTKLQKLEAEGGSHRSSDRTYRTRRPNEVRKEIVTLLQAQENPMSVAEIYQALLVSYDKTLSRSTVKNCLRDNSGSPRAYFERVRHGWYRVKKQK